jgi:iron complex transport system permease protein
MAVLALALLAALCVAVAFGATRLPLGVVVRVVLSRIHLVTPDPSISTSDETILLTFRLPRAVGAALVGAALSTAGVLFQGLLRNPLADSYVVGSSGGAALGAVLGMLLGRAVSFLGFGIVPLAAFAGAVAATLLVVQLSTVGGRLPVVSVLLAGFAVSTLLAYTVSLLLVVSTRLQVQLPEVYAWLLGGISVTDWGQILVIGPLIACGVAAALGMGRSLNAFSLGEDGAARLGIQVERDKRLLLGLGALLTAAAVSISGLVGFVGLFVPHVTRMICGPNHRRLIPAAALSGALFLVLADLLARSVLPGGELPLGIVTAFIGGPFFLWLLRRSRKEYQW